jgi:hypothetical protein
MLMLGTLENNDRIYRFQVVSTSQSRPLEDGEAQRPIKTVVRHQRPDVDRLSPSDLGARSTTPRALALRIS